MEELRRLLCCTTLQKLVEGKENLVEVPYTATVDETLKIMGERNIDAVLVALPCANTLDNNDCAAEYGPDWMALRGKAQRIVVHGTILDEEAIEQHHNGIVTTFDILTYFAKLLRATNDINSTTPSNILNSPIHHCIERKTIYMMRPSTSVLEAMERMIDGVHVALVPHSINRKIPKLARYSLFTPMDIIQFFKTQAEKFKPISSQSVKSLNTMQPGVHGVWGGMSLLDTIKCMQQASVSVVPIVEIPCRDFIQTEELLDAKGKTIVGTFSASDLKGCPSELLRQWATDGVLAFLKKVVIMKKASCLISTLEADPDGMYEVDIMGSFLQFDHVSCFLDSTIGEVIDTALQDSVHKVWIVEKDCVLIGAVSLMDILRLVRKCIDT